MEYCPNELVYIQTKPLLYLIKYFSIIFLFLKQKLKISVIVLSLEEIKEQHHWIGNYHMSCCLKILIYVKTNFFLYLVQRLSKSFFDLKVKLKMLVLLLSLKDNTEYICLNQHWIGRCAMLSQMYLDNIGKTMFLYNTGSLWDNNAEGFCLCNVVPRVLKEHWTGFFLMQCCQEPEGQHYIRFFLFSQEILLGQYYTD